MTAFGSSKTTLTGRFAFHSPALLFARAVLSPTHLTLIGWTWRGRYRRQIAITRILHVDARQADELILWLFDGETVRLRLNQAHRWKAEIERQILQDKKA